MDVKIVRVDNRSLMQIGETQIEVADYNIKSSADGSTELSVTIKENAPTFELSASLRWNLIINDHFQKRDNFL